MSESMGQVTVDGRNFDLDKLSGEARQQALNINLVDEEIRHLQIRLAFRRDGEASTPVDGEVACRPAPAHNNFTAGG